MKKDLFDHILIVDNNVEFGCYRKMTVLEQLNSNLLGKIINYGENCTYISPKTFKEFLRCLKKTKLTKKLDFRIAEQIDKKFYEISLNCLVNHFMECISIEHPQSAKNLTIFCNSVTEILTNKIIEQQSFNNSSNEIIK